VLDGTELGFEWIRMTANDACFMRPLEWLYPHLEVFTHDYAPEYLAHHLEAQGEPLAPCVTSTMWHKWSPGDLQVRRKTPSGLALS
jgi:hypothetical protein